MDKDTNKAKQNNSSVSGISASSTSSEFASVSGAQASTTEAAPLDGISPISNSSSSTSSAAVQDDGTVPKTKIRIPNDELTKELLSKLLNAFETVKECTFKTMSLNLNGPIPEHLMETLMSISGSKNQYCSEIVHRFSSLLSGQDKDAVLVEWRKNLVISSEETFSTASFPVELHTLCVIDGHLTEVFKHPTYSVLLSLKHTLISIVNLIYYLLPATKDDAALSERVKTLLVPLLFDIRTEYLYDIANKCLENILDGDDSSSEAYQLLAFTNVLKHSNKLLIDYSDMSSQGRSTNLDENVLHHILRCWEQMLDKQTGLKAMHEFFFIKKQGSLVQVLLSFSNTSLTQLYSTKVLQFFEKLFQACEKSTSPFKLDELCACVSELGQVDSLKLKNWLSHILLGPGGINATAVSITSAASSNVQTPTNMATVSAIPSISDQPSDLVLDPNAMDIDYDCSAGAAGPVAAGGGTSSSVWHAGTTVTTTNRSGSDTPNEECLEKNGRLLQTLTKYIVYRISPNVATALFQALIQLGQNILCPTPDSMEFTDLLQVIFTAIIFFWVNQKKVSFVFFPFHRFCSPTYAFTNKKNSNKIFFCR